MIVNRNNIEKILDNCETRGNVIEELHYLEEKNKIINGEKITDIYAIRLALERIKFHLDRFDTEKYAKSVILMKNNCLRDLEKEIKNLRDNYNDERQISLIKDLITYIEMSFDMDITFYTSLLNLGICAEGKNKVNVTDIKKHYRGRR